MLKLLEIVTILNKLGHRTVVCMQTFLLFVLIKKKKRQRLNMNYSSVK